MAGIINKVKAAVTGDKNTTDNGTSGMYFLCLLQPFPILWLIIAQL